ncbi:glycosyl hydrolase family 18 protein [Motilimonas eburnea]|uniref:glycosyl hydrolase family 18 protein n=1 Tax=Motilimonas eburnea TaxID=1737488 RepID=UPI001E2F4059|nr:glycosyl hydrolase family 18 protein [Motilimonas eburnea]MCE2572406.1 LytTR family transcriptional regulator DNA-binding domain-containing protein [Motilimonas eburnea]
MRSLWIMLAILCNLLWVNLVAATENTAIMAYYKQWGIYSPNYHIKDVPGTQITHLVYQSAKFDSEGTVEVGDEYADLNLQYPDADENLPFSGNFGQMVSLKKIYPHIKTIISIGGWGRSEHYSNIAADPQLRADFAKSAIEFMKYYQFDGIEIDWNFPVITQRAKQHGLEADKQNFTLLLAELNEQLYLEGQKDRKKYLLISTIPAAVGYEHNWQVKEVSQYLDLISLSTAYMHGYWEEIKLTNHITPLYLNSATQQHFKQTNTEANSVDIAVRNILQQGAPAEKIVINIASFATAWDQVPRQDNGLYQVGTDVSWGSWDTTSSGRTGLYNRGHLVGFLDNPAYQKHWDNSAKASWLFNPDKNGGHFVSYESEDSLSEKVSYMERLGLAGIAIRQVHNDLKGQDSLIRQTYAAIYPWQAILFQAELFYTNYKTRILLTIAFTLLMILLLIRVKYIQYKEEEADVKDRDQYLKLKSQLQQLNTPLQGIAALSQRIKDHQNLLAEESQIRLHQIGQTGLEVNHLIHSLLHDTNLAQSPRNAELGPVNFKDILNVSINILLPYIDNKGVHIDSSKLDDNTTVIADPVYLQKLLITLISWATDNCDKGKHIYFSASPQAGSTCISMLTEGAPPVVSLAQMPNISLIKQCVSSLCADIKFDAQAHQHSCHLLLQQALPPQLAVPKVKVLPADPHQQASKQTQLETANERLQSLQAFSSHACKLKDINELIKEAFDVFINDPSQPTVKVYQGDNVIHTNEEDNDEHQDSITIAHPDLGEFSFELYSKEPLTEDDVYYFHSLVTQIQMVRRQLHEITKEPQLLSELYDIASRKDKLLYIKAEKGYSGIYLPNKSDPIYLTLRLKTIKLYFDDEVLLQIHRSWLINPKKVVKVHQVTKLKYEVEIDDKRLPIARPYVPVLKQHFPHWFSAR